jgi:hypothetical protein
MNKHLKYLKYVVKHKYYVARECFKEGLYWRGIVHDWTKLTPKEWIPYTEYFYGEKRNDLKHWRLKTLEELEEDRKRSRELKAKLIPKLQEEIEIDFNKAWLHHIHLNDHHWNHWLLQQDSGELRALEMPDVCIKEMIADWRGANKAIFQTYHPNEEYNPILSRTWYIENYRNIKLHINTRKKVNKYYNIEHIMTDNGYKLQDINTKDILLIVNST